ncbi:tryptophan synthase subunit beta [Candidatus Peregrinibacteria bacterium]|nr:tryptophan synthase subunit beta [Candidatus Peregrinibacteria bacterium]
MKLITFFKKSIAGELSAEKQIKFLNADLNITPKELAATVQFLQSQIPKKPRLENAMDVCGTGGSGLLRINTSTIAAFLLSSLGVGVAKHGNKAASGRFGSFDLLESLGIEFTDNVIEIEEKYKKENIAFLFAPFFHPVMKHFAETRKKIGKPTFFNLLGPLLNPAFPKKQIIGTAFRDKMLLIAETCRLLGKEKVYVVCGEDGLDEVTLTGRTFVTEFSDGTMRSYTISPKDFGVSKATFSEIQGGNAEFNTEIARKILAGTCKTRHQDLVLMNVALALKLADKVKTLKEGYKMATRAINIPSILLKIVEQKRLDVERRKRKNPIKNVHPSTRNFTAAIQGNDLALIAEIKKASPSEGIINKKRFSPALIAKKYERFGANAISVLCDKKFFHGDIKHLKNVAENTSKIPLLCKDFIIDEYQMYEARKNGADAILLIASILTEEQIRHFLEVAKSMKMAVICEVHNFEELKKVLKTPAKIIGINNRDLHTFKINISTTLELVKHVPPDKLIISESGFSSKKDVAKVRGKVDAILVGAALMKGVDISEFTQRTAIDHDKIIHFPRIKEVIRVTKKYMLNKTGHFGKFGGRYIPELLIPIMEELETAFYQVIKDQGFKNELKNLYQNYSGRPTPLYFCENLTNYLGGAQIFLKNEGLNHTGAHKINHCLGQALLAKRLGKKRLIAETGAGQHGLATATVAAKFGLDCAVYMGAKDFKRQLPNVFFMERLGAKVVPVKHGGQILRDAINAALKDLMANPKDTHYLLGTVCGPHPYPAMNTYFQSIVGQEVKNQLFSQTGKTPDYLVACVGGGSNAMGLFYEFLNDKNVKMIGVEAGGKRISEDDKKCQHAARFQTGKVGVAEGFKSYFLQNQDGQIKETHSISAGLDYSGVGPQIAYLKDIGRIQMSYSFDRDVLRAYELLARQEGIFAALESCHALAEVIKLAPKLKKDKIIIFNCSGRGDKDLFIVSKKFNFQLPEPK